MESIDRNIISRSTNTQISSSEDSKIQFTSDPIHHLTVGIV